MTDGMGEARETGALDRRVRAGYGLGSVATGAFGTVPGLMLLPYLTDTLGIASGVAAAIVFLPKAWDVLLNPVAGRISDRTSDPRGRRRPWLLRGGLPLALFFVLMFASPDLGSRLLDGLWVTTMFVLCATAYAFFQVPYVAMPAEMTQDYDERTRLMTWRVSILALAIMLSGASAPAVRNAAGGGRGGYLLMSLCVAALLVVGVLGAYRGTRRAPVGGVGTGGDSATLREQLRVVAAVDDFRRLLTTFVLQALAIGSMLAGVDYVSRYVLGDPAAATLLFVCFVGPALLLTPAWAAYGARVGKKRGYVAASLVLVVAAVVLTGARSEPTWVVLAATALVGCGYAGVQVFPLAMLPDVAAADARRTGHERAGVFTGVWTAGETLGLALGPGIYALLLTAGGYVSSTGGGTIAQPGSAVTAIVLGFSVLPAVLVLASLLPLRRYRLDAAALAADPPAASPDERTDP